MENSDMEERTKLWGRGGVELKLLTLTYWRITKREYDVCVTVHHIWKWREVLTWCNNCKLLSQPQHLGKCHLFSINTCTHSPATYTPTPPIQRLIHHPLLHTHTRHTQPLRQPHTACPCPTSAISPTPESITRIMWHLNSTYSIT